MAAQSSILHVSRRRSDFLVAGLSWHALFETDLRERERLVSEFAQKQGIDRMCVLENPMGLQVGYCERGRMPVTDVRRPRIFSFVLAVKKFFAHDNLVLVWKIEESEDVRQYAVLVFENGLVALDYVAPASAVEDVVTNYLENLGTGVPAQCLTNDLVLFPEFTDISGISWFSETLESAMLRPPRKPRLVDAKKRPVQAILIFVGLVATCLAVAWYVWTEFVAKPKTTAPKSKPTAEQTYSRLLFEEIGKLGWSASGVQDVMIDMMQMPLSHEGWQLRLAICNDTECRYTWTSPEGTDPRLLAQFGKEVKRTIGSRENRIELSRPHTIALSGPESVERIRGREDAELLCQRENLILRELKIKATLQCNGIVWPEGAPRLAAELMVHRYPISISGDWVSLDRLLERYSGAAYWREVRLVIEPSRTNLLELLQFELNGDIYGYR